MKNKINSISGFLEKLPNNDDVNHVYVFRGHASTAYELKPSIYRNPKWIANEHSMIQELILRCPDDFKGSKSSFDKLVKMQHYDFPTRLLDITENPLVALYFACECIENNELEKDGEVIIFQIPKKDIKYSESDTVSVLSNIAWMDSDFCISNKTSINFTSKKYAKQFLHFISREKPYFEERILTKDLEKAVCVKPKQDNNRIIQQQGAFFIFGMQENKRSATQIKFDYEDSRIVIDHKNKTKILKELAQLGITSAKLFPEIDSVARFIKEADDLPYHEFVSPSRLTKRMQFT
ncbi:FRG domain-containing protein [Pseudoalteromonas elyakovii]|nr:FRG domain-containing protein [Pseudoalteromonas elyakovii]